MTLTCLLSIGLPKPALKYRQRKAALISLLCTIRARKYRPRCVAAITETLMNSTIMILMMRFCTNSEKPKSLRTISENAYTQMIGMI